jgi:hypothetical protein
MRCLSVVSAFFQVKQCLAENSARNSTLIQLKPRDPVLLRFLYTP